MQYLVLYQSNAGLFKPAMLSFSSTQLKKARQLNSAIDDFRVTLSNGKSVKPPMFYRAYSFQAVREANDYGSWFGYSISAHCPIVELPNGTEGYKTAKAFREQVDAGEIDLSRAAESEASSTPSTTDAF